VTIIREFLSWWVQQLAELLPERLRRPDVALADALLVVPDGSLDADPPSIDLLLRKRGQISRLGHFALDGPGIKSAQRAAASAGGPLPIQLRLPPGLLLEKHLTLPLAAERELVRVVGYEMDRETPFAADEVYWDSTVEHRDRVNGRLKLRLSLPQGETRRIALARGARRPGMVGARALPAAAIACAVLALIAAATPFVRQAIEFGRVDSRIAALQPNVDEAEALRRRIEGNTAGSDVLTEQRARLGDVLKVLAAATQILPDDTHLTDFTMRQRKVNLNGQSAAAPKLIEALSGDPTFQNPTFVAPVTHTDMTKDVFSISTEAKP
jgi:general secretion pathway protein L